jgi:hypothetical protein
MSLYSNQLLNSYREEYVSRAPQKEMRAFESDLIKSVIADDPISYVENLFNEHEILQFRGYPELIRMASIFSRFEGVREAFLRLPQEIASKLMRNIWNFTAQALAVFILLTDKFKYPVFLKIDPLDPRTIIEFVKIVKSLDVSYSAYAFDSERFEISKNFLKLTSSYSYDPYYTNISTLFLMRLAIEEDQILEMLNKHNSENSSIGLFDFLRIAQDWDELKDQPLDWALEMAT